MALAKFKEKSFLGGLHTSIGWRVNKKKKLQFLEEKKIAHILFQTKTNIPNKKTFFSRSAIANYKKKKNYNLKKKTLRFFSRSAVANAVTSIQPSAGGR